ncbi:MAG: PTS sugar transporter subunit IIA [Bacteroidetes bacterium]|nr:PTS sugar transporter subunit IIA [Bacteroidota bacterium]
MELKIKDIVGLLQVNEKTVYRWIKEKKIPCYRINHQYRFNRAEINEWILSNKIELSSTLINLGLADHNLPGLLEKGGIVSPVPGTTVAEVITNAVERIDTPQGLKKEDVILALMHREELMPTAIGRGVAIPHPRNPIVTDPKNASVSICYLEHPTDFRSLDGRPVHTLFILFTATPRMHLEVLSKISHLCQNDFFLEKLSSRATKEEVLEFVREKEKQWQTREQAGND